MSIAAALESNLREHVRDALPLITELMVDDTRQAAPRRNGGLWESIGADPWIETGSSYTTTIYATAPYARYQDEGTGVYGPEGAPIAAPGGPGHPMKFYWDAVGGWRSLYEIRGTSPTRFFDAGSGGRMEQRYQAATIAAFA